MFGVLINQKNRLLSKYYKITFKRVGENLKVFGKKNPYIKGKTNIIIGDNCRINEFSYFNARNNSEIVLEDNVTVSSYAKILTASYDPNLLIGGYKEGDEDIHRDKSVFLGTNCWIGLGAIILPGVKITGENVIIGAGAVVTKSISKSNVLVAGNPAKVVKEY